MQERLRLLQVNIRNNDIIHPFPRTKEKKTQQQIFIQSHLRPFLGKLHSFRRNFLQVFLIAFSRPPNKSVSLVGSHGSRNEQRVCEREGA